MNQQNTAPKELAPGQRVRHQHKGDGTVVSVDNDPTQVFRPLTYTVKWDGGHGPGEPLIHPDELTPM